MMRLPLYHHGRVVAHAIVDAQDAHLAAYRWHPVGAGYAARSANGHRLLLHREVMGLARGDDREIDHRNRDKLDCRRANLRIVTHAENQQNFDPAGNTTWRGRRTSSHFRGVSFDCRRGKWKATVTVGGVTRQVGRFDTELAAARAADAFRAQRMPFAEVLGDPAGRRLTPIEGARS